MAVSRLTSEASRSRLKMRSAYHKKEEPRRGECRGSYALHRTHYLPRPNTPGHVQHALNLWQFFDGSLSISFFTTRICAPELTFPRPPCGTPEFRP